MAFLLDTCVLVDAERSGGLDEHALAAREPEQERSISVVTVSELLHGVHRAVGDRVRARRLAFVEGVLARLEPIPIGPEVARIHAEVWARLEAEGAIVGAHDLWIAATALAHGLTVMTSNAREFERVPDWRCWPSELRADRAGDPLLAVRCADRLDAARLRARARADRALAAPARAERRMARRTPPALPAVSLIVAAHDEEAVIAAKVAERARARLPARAAAR